MQLWPDIFLKNYPSGHFQTFILSGAPDAKVYSFGWNAKALTAFLWFVKVILHFPAAKSHNFIKESAPPEIIYGSNS